MKTATCPGLSLSYQTTVMCGLGVCAFLWLAGFPAAQAADWPGFRGPAADGIAEQERAPTHFDQTSNLVWKAEIPAGHSSPVVWKGQLFLTGSQGNTLNTL